MKKKITLLFLFFSLIMGLAVYGFFSSIPIAQEGEDIPRIKVSPNIFDFGNVNYGEIVKYTFIIENSGEEILEIKRVSTSCLCASAEIEKENILPGEKINLYVEYDTGAMSGRMAMGRQERIIYLRSNDPLNPQKEILIKAYVE